MYASCTFKLMFKDCTVVAIILCLLNAAFWLCAWEMRIKTTLMSKLVLYFTVRTTFHAGNLNVNHIYAIYASLGGDRLCFRLTTELTKSLAGTDALKCTLSLCLSLSETQLVCLTDRCLQEQVHRNKGLQYCVCGGWGAVGGR